MNAIVKKLICLKEALEAEKAPEKYVLKVDQRIAEAIKKYNNEK